jgi:cysteinyl-tRNA synthetase
MSKSAGNFYTLRDLLGKGFKPTAVKYLLLSMSYRRVLNFTFVGLEEAEKKLKRIRGVIERTRKAEGEHDAGKQVKKAMRELEQAMDDNLNTGKALKVMDEFTEAISTINPNGKSSEKVIEVFKTFDSILGLGLFLC